VERLAEISARCSRPIYRSPAKRAVSAARVIVAECEAIGRLKITRCVCQARAAANNLHRAEGSGLDQLQGGPRESGCDGR
jgi:hypothetical protein